MEKNSGVIFSVQPIAKIEVRMRNRGFKPRMRVSSFQSFRKKKKE